MILTNKQDFSFFVQLTLNNIMKKVLSLIIALSLLVAVSCEEDEDTPECKDCWTRTFDEDGDIESEGSKSTYCEEVLYEKQTTDTIEIGGRKAIWVCK